MQLTHVIYGLHAAAVVIGVTSSATVAGGFVFGLPSLIAVLLNYLKRSDVRGTWLESHFVWQIRTFWFHAALADGLWPADHHHHRHSAGLDTDRPARLWVGIA